MQKYLAKFIADIGYKNIRLSSKLQYRLDLHFVSNDAKAGMPRDINVLKFSYWKG